jgi:hypothetical protein
MLNSVHLFGTTPYLSFYTRFRINRYRSNGARMYFIVPPKRYFYCAQKDEKWKNWTTKGTNYIILQQRSVLRNRCGQCFVCMFCLSFLCFDSLLWLSNCKQWLEHQQCWENQSFRIDSLGDLDTISLIDVYERLIHDAIQ